MFNNKNNNLQLLSILQSPEVFNTHQILFTLALNSVLLLFYNLKIYNHVQKNITEFKN